MTKKLSICNAYLDFFISKVSNSREYTGVRLTVGYEVTNKENGKIVLLGETKHCFTDKNLKPINLKKAAPDFSEKFANL